MYFPPCKSCVLCKNCKKRNKGKIRAEWADHFPITKEEYQQTVKEGSPYKCIKCHMEFLTKQGFVTHLNSKCTGMILPKPKWKKLNGRYLCDVEACSSVAAGKSWCTTTGVWAHPLCGARELHRPPLPVRQLPQVVPDQNPALESQAGKAYSAQEAAPVQVLRQDVHHAKHPSGPRTRSHRWKAFRMRRLWVPCDQRQKGDGAQKAAAREPAQKRGLRNLRERFPAEISTQGAPEHSRWRQDSSLPAVRESFEELQFSSSSHDTIPRSRIHLRSLWWKRLRNKKRTVETQKGQTWHAHLSASYFQNQIEMLISASYFL